MALSGSMNLLPCGNRFIERLAMLLQTAKATKPSANAIYSWPKQSASRHSSFPNSHADARYSQVRPTGGILYCLARTVKGFPVAIHSTWDESTGAAG